MTAATKRRALQIALAALSVVPTLAGGTGLLLGPRVLPGDRSRVEASLDSEYRLLNAFLLAAAPAIWKAIPRVEQPQPALRLFAAAGFAGGIGRVLAWRASGRPHPAFVAATVIEIVGLPALLALHEQVRRDAAR